MLRTLVREAGSAKDLGYQLRGPQANKALAYVVETREVTDQMIFWMAGFTGLGDGGGRG